MQNTLYFNYYFHLLLLPLFFSQKIGYQYNNNYQLPAMLIAQCQIYGLHIHQLYHWPQVFFMLLGVVGLHLPLQIVNTEGWCLYISAGK